MSRTVITAVVAAVIAALTAIAYFVTSQSFAERARKDAEAQLGRAYKVIQNINTLQSIDFMSKAERLGARPELVTAVKSSGEDRRTQAQRGFQKFMAEEKQALKPDIIALVDANGELLAMYEVPTVVPKQWQRTIKVRDKEGKETEKVVSLHPAVNIALGKKVIISDLWDDEKQGMYKIGVAPVIDPDAPINSKDPDGVVIIGAVIVAYAQTAKNAQLDKGQTGTEIAYFSNKNVVASSFTREGGVDEDSAMARSAGDLFKSGKLTDSSPTTKVSIGGRDYYAASVKMVTRSSKPLPNGCAPPKAETGEELPRYAMDSNLAEPCFPPVHAGAVVLSPITVASSTAGTVKMFILLLGIGALAIAMLGIYLVHRRLVAQVDQVEQGVTDIINGNVDRTFRPVGPELDGLSNGLNVMLARLLGRPEPGEEEFDDEGNPIIQGRVEFEEGAEKPAADPDLAALAQESEPDYYKRVYTEYLAAKRASGNPDEVSFENFIAKLKVNEGKLKAQYQCRAVRFRVVTKDGKVTLKPVPIFA